MSSLRMTSFCLQHDITRTTQPIAQRRTSIGLALNADFIIECADCIERLPCAYSEAGRGTRLAIRDGCVASAVDKFRHPYQQLLVREQDELLSAQKPLVNVGVCSMGQK